MDNNNRIRQTQTPPRHGEDTGYRSKRDEEYATEFSAHTNSEVVDDEVISMYGWIGIALAVLSFFMWPIVLGAAGIILGFVSRAKGAQVLGNIAIAIGILAIVSRLILMPLF